jgi:hypothetical protein
MNARTLAALALAVAVVTGDGVAAVAKAPVCRQVLDGTGDAYLDPAGLNVAKAPSSDALDIVSADVATGRKNLVAAIRLKTLQRDPFSSASVTYLVEWNAGGAHKTLAYREYLDGTEPDARFQWSADVNPITAPAVKFGVTTATATVMFVVPRKMDPALKKPGVTLTGLKVTSAMANNRANGFGHTPFDTAVTNRKYVDGTATCLKGT